MKHAIEICDYRVSAGANVNLDKWPTSVEPFYESKKEYKKLLAAAPSS